MALPISPIVLFVLREMELVQEAVKDRGQYEADYRYKHDSAEEGVEGREKQTGSRSNLLAADRAHSSKKHAGIHESGEEFKTCKNHESQNPDQKGGKEKCRSHSDVFHQAQKIGLASEDRLFFVFKHRAFQMRSRAASDRQNIDLGKGFYDTRFGISARYEGRFVV